jgi:predicted acetyltransferase
MPELRPPSLRQASSFRAAMADFAAEGRGLSADDSAVGRELREFGGSWHTDAGLAEFIESLRRDGDPSLPPPAGWVHTSTYWWVDVQHERYLGSVRIRHNLSLPALQVAGHIGYDIAPSARLQGHGTAMLAAALPVAAGLGIDAALISCDLDNIGSRKIIEANGGKLEDERDGKFRFWVPTS